MAFLEINNYHKRFGENEVLKGISFSLEKGEVLAVIGSSGGGKTTLLRCLNFLEMPDEGTLTLNGELLFDASRARGYSDAQIREKRLHFGLVFQQFNLFPQYTVFKNIALAQTLQFFGQKRASESEASFLLSLSAVFEIPLERISFKSKSHEHVGEIGRGEAAMCQAVATLKIRSSL